MVICSKGISEECFSFNFNVNASLSFFEHLEGFRRALRHLGTCELGHTKRTQTLGHLSHSGTRALRALKHLGT